MTPAPVLESRQHRLLAAELFNHAWELLEKLDRTREEDEELIHAAHASRYHWRVAGTALNHARGDWQIARAYAELSVARPALYYARRCLDACSENTFSPCDCAFAHEGMARAHVVAGEMEEACRCIDRASRVGRDIEDDKDRDWLYKNLDEITATVNAP